MTWDPTPWAINGARTSADVARLAIHALAGSDARGIVAAGDLKVKQTPTASNRLVVSPGGVLIPNAYPQAFQETYIGRNPTDDMTPVIEPTTTAGRSDLVVVRVEDRQFEGQALTPEEAATFQYVRTEVIRGVPASTRSVRELGLTYPAYELARVDIPAGTSTFTNAMIVDLRKMAIPREKRGQHMGFPTEDSPIPTTRYSGWPKTVGTQVDVPEWATTALVSVHLSGIEVTGGGGARTVAGIRTYLGPGQEPSNAQIGRELGENGILIDPGTAMGTVRRHHLSIAGRHDVRWARGTRQWIMTQGLRSSGTGLILADYQSTLSVEWTFIEEAV